MGALIAGSTTDRNIQSPMEAAKAFEALLLKELLGSMSKTVESSGLFGDGFEAGLYGEMFISAIAEESAGSALGLGEMIQQALGVERRTSAQIRSLNAVRRGMSTYQATRTGDTAPPANPILHQLANEWLSGDAALRWGKSGELTTADVGATLETPGIGGTAVFNVLDAAGYKNHPKCNVFAFEMLRRAGYSVPVRPRRHGWGYPGADTVTRWSEDGKVNTWAHVQTHRDAGALDAEARQGIPFLLASSAPDSAAGHMAVADRIHAMRRGPDGRIEVVEYSGWEAGSKQASYKRRVWRLASVPGEGRGGLDRIEVLRPHQVYGRENLIPVGTAQPGASIHDRRVEMSMSAQGSVSNTDTN